MNSYQALLSPHVAPNTPSHPKMPKNVLPKKVPKFKKKLKWNFVFCKGPKYIPEMWQQQENPSKIPFNIFLFNPLLAFFLFLKRKPEQKTNTKKNKKKFFLFFCLPALPTDTPKRLGHQTMARPACGLGHWATHQAAWPRWAEKGQAAGLPGRLRGFTGENSPGGGTLSRWSPPVKSPVNFTGN